MTCRRRVFHSWLVVLESCHWLGQAWTHDLGKTNEKEQESGTCKGLESLTIAETINLKWILLPFSIRGGKWSFQKYAPHRLLVKFQEISPSQSLNFFCKAKKVSDPKKTWKSCHLAKSHIHHSLCPIYTLTSYIVIIHTDNKQWRFSRITMHQPRFNGN